MKPDPVTFFGSIGCCFLVSRQLQHSNCQVQTFITEIRPQNVYAKEVSTSFTRRAQLICGREYRIDAPVGIRNLNPFTGRFILKKVCIIIKKYLCRFISVYLLFQVARGHGNVTFSLGTTFHFWVTSSAS
jgi:hypothetical protein